MRFLLVFWSGDRSLALTMTSKRKKTSFDRSIRRCRRYTNLFWVQFFPIQVFKPLQHKCALVCRSVAVFIPYFHFGGTNMTTINTLWNAHSHTNRCESDKKQQRIVRIKIHFKIFKLHKINWTLLIVVFVMEMVKFCYCIVRYCLIFLLNFDIMLIFTFVRRSVPTHKYWCGGEECDRLCGM